MVLNRMEIQLRQIWHEYQRSLSNEIRAKALLAQYRILHESYKKQKIVIFG